MSVEVSGMSWKEMMDRTLLGLVDNPIEAFKEWRKEYL
jgi:hypothetical protein